METIKKNVYLQKLFLDGEKIKYLPNFKFILI